MTRRSAGLLLFRKGQGIEVFLVHPGGPFWAKKDLGAWSIPKGEYEPDEDALTAALREFQEETGFTAQGDFIPLGEVKQNGGKLVIAWAVEQDVDAAAIRSNTFEMPWPPRSGRMCAFPEVDRAGWFSIEAARAKLLPAQCEFLARLLENTKGRH